MLETAWESRWLPDIHSIKKRRNSSENGGVAQLGEHLPCKQGVKSSNLSVSIVKENFTGYLIIVIRKYTICSLKTEYRNQNLKYS